MSQLSKLAFRIGLVSVGCVSVTLAVTNPDTVAYENYAIKTLKEYLSKEVCAQAPSVLGISLEDQCRLLVDVGGPNMERTISRGTNRENYFLFSIYSTDLTVGPPPLPSYHFETIGIFQNFYTYQAKEEKRES